MEYIKLKDAFAIKKGKKVDTINKFSKDAIRCIQIDDLRNNNNLKYCLPESNNIIVKESDILIAWDGANAGTVGIGLKGALGSTLAKLELKAKEINPYFVALLLQSKFDYFQQTATGATIPHISRKALEEISLPALSMEKQDKIVATIQVAKSLIENRHSQITALDELAQSVFLEMFGNPVLNTKNYPFEKMGAIGVLERGKSKHRPRNAPELLDGPYPLIQTGDVANSSLYIKEFKSTYSEIGLQQSRMWPKGTLCITIAANIAKTGILKFDACFPDSVVGFVPSTKVSNIYMHYWFSFFQQILEAEAPESAQKNINLKILKDIEVIVPPIQLIEKFEERITAINEYQEKLVRSLEEIKSLYNSLLHQAFQGKLL